MMKKLLFVLTSMLMLSSGLMAQNTVTINFDNDYATLFPELAGVSSNESHDGDILETMYSTPVDGVMVIISPEEGAKTPNRIWSSSPRLRMYSGTFAVLGSDITKIEFESNDKFNLTAVSGTLEGKTWTGEPTDLVMFEVGGNTQLKKIVVYAGEGGNDDGFGIEYESGSITETANQIVFDFVAIEVQSGTTVTGQLVFDFVDDLCTNATSTFVFPSAEIAQVAYEAMLEEAEEEGYDDLAINGATVTANMTKQVEGFSKGMVRVMLKMIIDDESLGEGTLTNPFTPVEANVFGALMFEPGETADFDVFVKGKVSSITYSFDAQHGTATFYISEDGSTSDQFLVYSTYYLENKPWVDGYSQIKVGDDVIVCGKLTNYNGTIEMANKKSFIYSLNGNTKAEDTPEPQVVQVTVTKALEIIAALEDSQTTTETYQVKGFVIGAPDFQRKNDNTLYGNVNLNMADTKDGQETLTVFRAKSFDGESFTEETTSLINEGDEVVFEGKLQKFVKNGVTTPELINGKLISVNGEGNHINGIAIDAQHGTIYNLQGQRVEKAVKGLYIIDGKKVVVK